MSKASRIEALQKRYDSVRAIADLLVRRQIALRKEAKDLDRLVIAQFRRSTKLADKLMTLREPPPIEVKVTRKKAQA
jgi:hypothetical protein